MEDYSKLLKDDLITELQKRDAEVEAAKKQVAAYQKTVNDMSTGIKQLKADLALSQSQSLAAKEITNTADGAITAILALPEAEKQLLPALTRTTVKGIQAYTTFLYGAATGLNEANESGIEGGNNQQDENAIPIPNA